MRKYKLSLDALRVETFDPETPMDERGTVRGAEYETRETYQPCASCAPTCNLYGYCTDNDYTCGSCQNCGTDNSCVGTCNACTPGYYTCDNTCGAETCICTTFCNTRDECEF